MIFELYDIKAFLDCLLCSLHITTSKVTPSEPTFSITAAPTSVRSPLITPAQRTPTLRVRVRHFRQRTRTALPSATNMWSSRARFCECLDGFPTPTLKELMIREESIKYCACGGVDCAAGRTHKSAMQAKDTRAQRLNDNQLIRRVRDRVGVAYKAGRRKYRRAQPVTK